MNRASNAKGSEGAHLQVPTPSLPDLKRRGFPASSLYINSKRITADAQDS